MTSADIAVWLVAGYALVLVAAAWGFDLMAKRMSRRAAGWRAGGFVYHRNHDAWQCPTDQWLWPTSFDPTHRVMRYRGRPIVCNSCPVKADCTTSHHGREISRQIDPWPHSEAGRFHRGIACTIAALALVMPAGLAISKHSAADLLVLGTTLLLVVVTSTPLFRHLWSTPVTIPDHLPQRSAHEDAVAAAVDKYATTWGVGRSGREGGAR